MSMVYFNSFASFYKNGLVERLRSLNEFLYLIAFAK